MDPIIEKKIVKKALLIRYVEERLLSLFSQNKLSGTVHTCIGQEFSGAVISEFIEAGDAIFSNHRCHGHFLSITDDVNGLFAEIMGKKSGVCGGRGGSQHLCKDSFYSNGIQGGIVPVAGGMALARKLDGNGKIAVVFIGDGTLGQGIVYEMFNIAQKWKMPLLFVLENNCYSQSTMQDEVLAGHILARAESFGIKTDKCDTWDWKNLYSVSGALIKEIRQNSIPGFLQIDTFRLKAHSKGDDDRPKALIQKYEKKDPLSRFLAEKDTEWQPRVPAIKKRIDKAVALADISDVQSIEDLYAFSDPDPPGWIPAILPNERVGNVLNATLKKMMAENPATIFIGEDVRSPYGGAFKVSAGLSDLYPGRVVNTPISEAAIVGIGCGLAMSGYKPLVEIMFGDFISLAFDQILNHASKFPFMYNAQTRTNMVLRTPMGGGRGYGPTHSQTLDKHFLGIPGLTVVALSNLIPPQCIYDQVFKENPGPILVIENKQLYTQYLCAKPPKGFTIYLTDEKYPCALLTTGQELIDVILIGYGGLGQLLVDAANILFEEYDLLAHVLCPSRIYPFSIDPYVDTIDQSQLVVIVEEGQGFAGFGAEVAAQIAERHSEKIGKVIRHYPIAVSIPASPEHEKKILPSVESIVDQVIEHLPRYSYADIIHHPAKN